MNNRRNFVKTISLGAAGTLLVGMNACSKKNGKGQAGEGPAVENNEWPSDRLNLALVGVAGRGKAALSALKDHVNVVALCDVDWNEATYQIFDYFPKAKRYKDFRVMFEKQKDIDAVVIATPDHTHGVIAMMAIEAGKHLFCEKPLAHSLNEVRMITEAARAKGIQTQMGNQGHSSNEIRAMVEAVRAGVVGDIREIHAWCDRPAGGGIVSFPHGITRPEGEYKVPKTLDWDLWLGPAMYRPYHPIYTPKKWRGFFDFGCGALGDFGCHTLDPSFWALDLGNPTSVVASTTNQFPEVEYDTFPTASIVTYSFPERGELPPVKLTWYDGGLYPSNDERFRDINFGTNGALLIGEKGMIQHGSHGAGGLKFIPYDNNTELAMPPRTIERIEGGPQGHHLDWLNACKTGKPASGNFEYGGPLSEMVALGVVATRFRDQFLEWDPESARITNVGEANNLIYHEFREGWSW